jgi:hypothetical protein
MSVMRVDQSKIYRILFILVTCNGLSCVFHNDSVGGSALAGGKIDNVHYYVCTGKPVGQEKQPVYKEVTQIQWNLMYIHEIGVIICCILFVLFLLSSVNFGNRNKLSDQERDQRATDEGQDDYRV